MKKRLLLMLAFVMVLTVLSGCGGSTAPAPAGETGEKAGADSSGTAAPAQEGELLIGMSFQELNNEYFIVMKDAFEAACKSIGAKTVITDAAHDVNKQISDVEDMIQQGIKILILNPADSAGVEAAVQSARKAGVIVISVDAQAEGPINCFVGSKNYDAGYLAGKEMVKDLGGQGKVAILDGIPVVPILQRVEGFKAAVAEAPGIEIVDTQNGKQERDHALTVTENMLQSNADLKAIFSVNDVGSLGALAAIEGASSQCLLYSVDGSPEAVQAVKAGGNFKATSAQFPRDQIRIGLGMALATYWGAEKTPAEVPVDVQLINKDNAEGFSW